MKRNKIKCEFCGIEVSLSNYSKHKNSKQCINRSNGKLIERIYDVPVDLVCDFCGKKTKNSRSYKNHILKCKLNPDREYKNYKTGTAAWNTGLTKETDERVKNNGESVSKTMQEKIENGTFIVNRMGIDARRRQSEKMSLNNVGGRCKWYNVNGISVQGTWERDIAIILTEKNIIWEKIKTNNHLFKYEMNGKIRSYAPDFYLPEYDIYLEIKGYWWGNDKEKMDCIFKQYPEKRIIIIEKEQYLKILEGELVW